MQEPWNLNILIVDDHELIRRGMRLLLEESLHVASIAEAGSAEEALEMAAGSAFDIILMDINLPGMSGHEAAGKLLSEVPQSRIIMITGNLEAARPYAPCSMRVCAVTSPKVAVPKRWRRR